MPSRPEPAEACGPLAPGKDQERAAPLERVTKLLQKQKLVESMVHSRSAPRQDLVETVVHRQHTAEFQHLLRQLATAEIAAILEALPIDDARLLWLQIAAERQNDMLWELPEELREQLVGHEEPGFSERQMNAFELVEGRLQQVTIRSRKDLTGVRPVWIDLVDTTAAERNYIGTFYGVELPDPGKVTDLEVSSRFHIEENEDIHLQSNFLLDRAGNSRSVPVAFVLHGGILFSLRNEELPVFRLQRRRARTQPGYVSDCKDLMLDLYGADVEHAADSLGGIYSTLGKVGRKVLSEKMSDEEAAAILAEIAEEEDINGRIRSNILDTQRAISFLMRCRILSPSQSDDAKQILRDIESLNSHTAFLFDKINFLMDATIGFININQNRRVNQLTVLGVVFMPINVLAGIGGMSEFSLMTQGIPLPVAYGGFIVGAGLVGWSTYVAVKHFENRKLKNPGRSGGR
ncbi:CorA family divalent cation transporter [Thauera sinica]|uniref:CorA family divalent cation transporter n=1 Tax=Thauera sinica TaxID=2665146 RepID=A0ABW1AN10_9RHOO|nr:CorA family divalent cation transporter [Thauera sp. K11]ATE60546.1 magnesium transporter CorA [Thauera sp. K11]